MKNIYDEISGVAYNKYIIYMPRL